MCHLKFLSHSLIVSWYFFLNNLYFMIVSEILDGRDFKKSPCQDEKDVILSGL